MPVADGLAAEILELEVDVTVWRVVGIALEVVETEEATVWNVVGTALEVEITAAWVETADVDAEADTEGEAPDPPTVKSTQDSYV